MESNVFIVFGSGKQFSGASVLSIIYTCFLACYSVSVSKIQVYIFSSTDTDKNSSVKIFDAIKNCLPKDKLQRNANFPVSPDFCQADCITEVTFLKTFLCFFHQNLRN